MVASRLVGAESKTDPHRFALLADTHINADPDTMVGDTNMTNNLKRVAAELVELNRKRAGVFVAGDLAHRSGESGDYAALINLLRPICDAGIPVHLALGNHDERNRFGKVIRPAAGEDTFVEHRHVMVVKSKLANFFILDSLDKTNATPGACGAALWKWLADALDHHADKPAITLVHHHPNTPDNTTGLIDTEMLWQTLLPRQHVKLHIFGHRHDWRVNQRDGLHLVSLPPTAYLFGKGRPNGWVDLRLETDGATMELYALDASHSETRQPLALPWRS